MPSVRARAIEITTQPDYFESPIPEYATAADAKLEADALLAICADGIAERVTTSPFHRQRFNGEFRREIAVAYSHSVPNSEIDPELATSIFGDVFAVEYRDMATVRTIADHTPHGRRATVLGALYADMSAEHEGYLDESSSLFIDNERYRDIPRLLLNGMATHRNELTRTLESIQKSTLSTEEKQFILAHTARYALQLGSLSMTQLRLREGLLKDPSRKGPEPDIQDIRKLPKHEGSLDEALRRHHMCVALPEFPKNHILSGGSALAKFWKLGIDMILATNMHALSDDRPEYQIASLAPYNRYMAGTI